MKKISLFSFLAAALLCVGQNAMAQTTLVEYKPNNTTSNIGTFTTDRTEGTIKIKKNTQTVYGYKLDSSIKFGAEDGTPTAYITIATTDGFKAGDVLTIQHCYNNSAEKTTAVAVYNNQNILLYTTNQSNNTRSVDDPSTDTYTLLADCSSLTLGRSGSTTTYITGLTVVRPAPKTEPWISITPAEVNLDVNPFAKNVEANVAIKGGNLTDGTYNLTLPSVEGLTIAPTSVTVADGALDATITLTYTSETNVEAAAAEASLTIGELTEKLTINYSARVSAFAQTTVSENTTWDWTKAGATEIKLTDTTAPKKNDTIVLANIDGIANNADFNSQALLVSGEFMVRDSKYFQGQYIAFKIEKAGTIQVEFSNTGNRDETDRRYLCVNGTKTEFGSIVTGTTTTSDAINVPAGTVEITFANATAEQYSRVYKIIYTKGTETSFEQAAVSEKAVKVVRDGQLYILRDGKTYNAQGIVVE